MKTLINTANSQIRITAPEIEVHEEEQMYIIPAGYYCIPLCILDWILVEEELDYDKQSGQQEPEYYQHFDPDC